MSHIITPTFYPHGVAPGARLVLVACAGAKLAAPAQARDLYLPSDLFRKSRAYAEHLIASGQADAWFILSAKYGLVAPAAVIEPYDVALARFKQAQRTWWGLDVIAQIQAIDPSAITALAGKAYRAPLRALRGPRCRLTVPMEGLEIGEQKAWLKRQLEVAHAG